MIRILQVLSSLQTGGGVQTMLKNYYAHMDLSAFTSDFVVCSSQRGEMESWFENLGAKVFHVPPRSTDPIGNIRALHTILSNGHYDVIHCHQDYHGALVLAMARRCGIPVRIIHSHQAFPPEKAWKRLRRRIESHMVMRDATILAACGNAAGAWLYGKDSVDLGRVIIMHNAIEPEKFSFSQANRRRLRAELSIPDNAIVVGHVGRFVEPKNHALLLKIFAEFYRHRQNSVLLLAGDGPLRQSIEQQASLLNIRKYIRFLGVRTDIPKILSAMDLFLLPSRYEGLGIVAIEAQANGLPCICSHKVPQEVKLTDHLSFISGTSYDDPSIWCSNMEQALSAGRSDNLAAIRAAGYDIQYEAQKLQALYLSGSHSA